MTFEESLSETLDHFIPIFKMMFDTWWLLLPAALLGLSGRIGPGPRLQDRYSPLTRALGAWIILLLLRFVTLVRPVESPFSSPLKGMEEPLNSILFFGMGTVLFILYSAENKRKKKKRG